MERDNIKEKIAAFAPQTLFKENSQFLEITVEKDQLHSILTYLKNEEDLQFNYLLCMTGVDWPEKLSVVYHLNSTIYQHTLVVKVFTENRETPSVDTVSNLWVTAEYHEREIYDLLGIRFNNHPDLRRLFLEDNWEGYPLRKDYKDEINMISL